MIIGIGTDLVAIHRIQQAVERFDKRFVDRIFAPSEYDFCVQRKDYAACLAKRFAAKEALVKALGTGMRDGVWFTDITVANNALGCPTLSLSGLAAKRLHPLESLKIHLSLSDENGFAQAFVVLERVED